MSTYRLVPNGQDFRLFANTPERELARFTRVLDRKGSHMGWRCKLRVVLNGPQSKCWPTIADALAGFKLMTPGAARRFVADALSESPAGER